MRALTSAHDDILVLTEAATAVAVSVLLGNLRLLELPSGGSITLACVPLLAFAAVRGVRRGLLVCVCAGFAHAASGGTIIHPAQLLLDYGVAYGGYALAGFAPSARGWRLRCAIIAAGLVTLAATTTSGVIFFAQGFSSTAAAVSYSLVYNAATIVPEILLALMLVPLAARSINRADPARAPRTGHSLSSGGARRPRPAPNLMQQLTRESDRLAVPRLQEESWWRRQLIVASDAPAAGPSPAPTRVAPAFVRPSPFGRIPAQLDTRPFRQA